MSSLRQPKPIGNIRPLTNDPNHTLEIGDRVIDDNADSFIWHGDSNYSKIATSIPGICPQMTPSREEIMITRMEVIDLNHQLFHLRLNKVIEQEDYKRVVSMLENGDEEDRFMVKQFIQNKLK